MASSSSSERAPPPPYAAQDDQVDDIVVGTQHLQLAGLDQTTSAGPNVDKVLLHLKLIHAFYALRQAISKEDGLFGFHDEDVTSVTQDSKSDNSDSAKKFEEELITRLMEKRWAVYITRAAKRFETWWNALKARHGAGDLFIRDMHLAKFETSVRRAPSGSEQSPVMQKVDLPPLDVLMVWHSFMLNPHCYLEDCLRQGMMALWHNDMPWNAINQSINSQTGYYNPTEAKDQFEALTGLNWSNLDDSETIILMCPSSTCRATLVVPFTAVSRTSIVEWTKQSMFGGIVEFPKSIGYADTDFRAICASCSIKVDHQRLCAAKFSKDCAQLWAEGERPFTSKPLAGTLLDSDGITRRVSSERDFPNRLLRTIIQQGSYPMNYISMNDVRSEIEIAIQDMEIMKIANKIHPSWIARKSQISVRRMMSRYWENSSPFALDLVGAVVRQASFIKKMESLHWLYSPATSLIVSRLLVKYKRFFYIMAMHPYKLVVPTLDIDLAWHTHQLTPSSYYAYSYTQCGERFIDHDDKVAETKLNDAFADTSRIYQMFYKEPYSECICWYCESIRASALSGVSGLFNRSNYDEIENSLHHPNNPNRPTSDPQRGPHISAHSAISPKMESNKYEAELSHTLAGLSEAYRAVCKSAKKSGRPIPPEPPMLKMNRALDDRDVPSSVAMTYYPFMMPNGISYHSSSGVYRSNPGCANFTAGATGNCAAGTCGSGGESG